MILLKLMVTFGVMLLFTCGAASWYESDYQRPHLAGVFGRLSIVLAVVEALLFVAWVWQS